MTRSNRVPKWRHTIDGLVELLTPWCHKIEVAGSIRRGVVFLNPPKDIDIVCEPRAELPYRLDELVQRGIIQRALVMHGTKRRTVWGPKQRRFYYGDLEFDLYMAPRHAFGYGLWLRTGPAEANKFVMRRKFGGNITFVDGEVFWHERRLNIPDEFAFFECLGIPYMHPQDRRESVYRSLFESNAHAWPNVSYMVLEENPDDNPEQLQLL